MVRRGLSLSSSRAYSNKECGTSATSSADTRWLMVEPCGHSRSHGSSSLPLEAIETKDNPRAAKVFNVGLTPIRRHTAPIALKSLGKHSVALSPGEIANVGPKRGNETPQTRQK